MKQSRHWRSSTIMMIVIVMISAYSILGLVLGQESGSFEGERKHRSESSEGGSEGSESSNSGDAAEGSGANALALDQTYDVTRNGARLILRYDAANNQSWARLRIQPALC